MKKNFSRFKEELLIACIIAVTPIMVKFCNGGFDTLDEGVKDDEGR